jgi:hypothetical protein
VCYNLLVIIQLVNLVLTDPLVVVVGRSAGIDVV